MAGIQFQLQEYLSRRTISHALANEAGKAIASVGVWWTTVAYLVLLAWSVRMTVTGSYEFYTIFTYAVVLSMTLSAPINAMVANSLADPIYLGDYHPVVTELTGALLLGTLLGFGAGLALAVVVSSQPLHICLLFASLCAIMTALWVVNNVMAILKKDRLQFFAFLIGFALSFLILIFLSAGRDLLGALLATVAVAFAFVVFFQYAYILKGFNRGRIEVSFAFVTRATRIPIVLAFSFFTLGLWVDKIVYWFMPQTTEPIDALFRFSEYDWPFFVAFSIFSLAHLLIFRNIQPLILEPYRDFTAALSFNLPFRAIAERKRRLIEGYRATLESVTRVYGPFVLLVFILTSHLRFEFPWRNPFIFHHALFSTYFFAFYSINFILLQYLQCYRTLAASALLFLALNGSLSLLVVAQGHIHLYGLPFAVASVAAAAASAFMIHRTLGAWEFEIFREVADGY